MITQNGQNKNSILKRNGNGSKSKWNFQLKNKFYKNVWTIHISLEKTLNCDTVYTVQLFYIKSWQRNEMKKSQKKHVRWGKKNDVVESIAIFSHIGITKNVKTQKDRCKKWMNEEQKYESERWKNLYRSLDVRRKQ